MKTLYKFHFNGGRGGDLFGLFIADSKEMAESVASGDDVYFGEVLGKHSDVYGPIQECDYTEVTNNQQFIAELENLNICVGYNPVETWKENK